MATLLIAVLAFLVLFALMAIGVAFGRPPIKGSCGGMSAMAGGEECPICGGDPVKCERSEGGKPPGPDVQPGRNPVRRFDPAEPREP